MSSFSSRAITTTTTVLLIFFYEIRTNRIGINFLTRLKQAFNKNINLLIYLIIIKSLNCQCVSVCIEERRPMRRHCMSCVDH